MTDYQEITLTETYEKLTVSTTEYPLTLAGIFYIKFIVYNKIDTDKGTFYDPIKFITLLPQNILKRENIYTKEEENEIIIAAQDAKDREATMAEYREAAEKEMRRRSQEIPPKSGVIPKEEDDDDIDPDFATKIDPHDPNYM